MLAQGRDRLGLDQAELGRRVGVGQQAVSRWERGRSRPRRAMAVAVAETLDLLAEDVLAAAGYIGAVADSSTEISPPVRPLARTLPFHELSPERFEDVCVEVLEHRHPGGHASRYGGSGERQDGIDVLIDGGLGATCQAKRHKQFGPAAVKAAVEAVTIPAPVNYLFLSRQTASAAARAEMKGHETWELWDGEDLSRYVRTQMSREEALRFVDAHFPNHREQFLGISQPGPWFSVEEFYAATSGVQLFTHDWVLVGRDAELNQLQAALDPGDDIVALIFGRGGIGKSRLLRTVADAFDADGWWVRMLPADSQPDPAAFELVPSQGSVLIIIDDAHERTDLGQIVARVRARNDAARLLIACRPYGRPDIERQLRRAGLDLTRLPTVSLGDLTQTAATHLACEALGPAYEEYADRLATLTRDCPLATTVGGYLIRTGELHTRELEQSDRIREQILLGFRDALLAESAHGDRDQRSAVIDAISALQPLRTGASDFQTAIATLVGVPYSRISRHLRSLEDSGVLIRRGDSVRIVPDLLGDVVLADACFDKRTGVDTGYLSEVLRAATGDALANAFINISRVDWQVGHLLTDAASPLWDEIYRELEHRELSVYLRIIALLSRVAPFQPTRVISAIGWILDNPIDEEVPETEAAWTFRQTWRHVLDEITPVLRGASYTIETFAAACGMLWSLAQSDRRAEHQYPNHPLRVLRDLASYAPEKPIAYNQVALELAESWSEEESQLSPLAPIEGLVATEGSTQTYRDRTLSFHPYAIRKDVVLPIRRRAIDLALREIRSGHNRRAVAGAQFAERALRYPTGEFGRTVSNDERSSWNSDFLQTIKGLRDALHENLDPVVSVAILEALHWHTDYGEGPPRCAAQSAVQDLPDTVEFDIALLLHDGWAALIRELGTDFETHRRAVASRLERVSLRAIDQLADNALVLLLEERLEKEMAAFDTDLAGGNQLLGALAERRPALALAIVDRLMENPQSALNALAANLIRQIGRWQPDALMNSVSRLLEHPSSAVRIEAAIGLASRDRTSCPLFQGELELLETFASGSEARLRVAVVDAARALADTDLPTAANLLARIVISDSRGVADYLFMCLSWEDSPLTWEVLSTEQRTVLLEALAELPNIEDHSVMAFLRHLSAREPKTVLGLLRRRVEAGEGMESLNDFRPVPFQFREPLYVRQHPDFLALLSDLLNWIAQGDPRKREPMGRALFAAAAGAFDDPVLSLLLETVRAGSETDARTVARVVEEAPTDLIFNHVDFVAELLASAVRLGSSALAQVRRSLHTCAISGTRWGQLGEPYAEDVRLRDQCAAIANDLPKGTVVEEFYRGLSEYGAQAVAQQLEEDDSDGRAW
ncbi:helix-turn-helix domain-containing protein [Mycobacterium sp. CPCC 205372]|uniref:Helix-turn-helix domain-containing protein n=2 Tax=Mycobacterium hippophais TaxID=3016340 RepID=A0ABT4PM58_9MYCO|nr:helix-turn-helix domain-containing protein [Mycobacterium hippophais]MCZ8377644.1 helix-turn-helix domain-containing protein [Mycobacterium hippophais]